MTSPLITILVCTKDRQDLLLQCLQSLKELDFDSFEVVVVDNGSKNFQIPEIATTFPIRYFSQPVAGISFARNSILRFCTGDFIALIDDDAIAHRDWLKSSMKSMEDNKVGCVTGRILPLQINSDWQQRYYEEGWLPAVETPKSFTLSNYDPFDTPAGAGTNIVARKSILLECGFPEFFGAGTAVGAEDDHYLFYNILKLGWKIQYDPNSIVYHPYPDTREQYEYLIKRSVSSRGAYICRFLFSESGYRLRTLRHIVSKLTRPRTRRLPMGMKPRTGGFVRGGIALLRSFRNVKERHARAMTSIREITARPIS
jgi:O-antigen biosynthesis protein